VADHLVRGIDMTDSTEARDQQEEQTAPEARRGWRTWWKRLGGPGQVMLTILLVIVVAALNGGGGSSGSKKDSAEYTEAATFCKDTAGLEWVVAHPSESVDNPVTVRRYAGAINLCLIKRMGVDPKYLPADKPIQGIRP